MNGLTELAVFLAAGLAGGVLLGLLGVGMALVTVPLLLMTLPMLGLGGAAAPASAVATSMAVVTLGSISSVFSHHRRGNVDWGVFRVIIVASLAGVLLGSLMAPHVPGRALQVIFAVFLIVVSLRMLSAGASASSPIRPARRGAYQLAGGLIGLAGSFIGAGGSVFMVPFLSSRGLKMPQAVATATTLGLPVSAVGAIIYAFQPSPMAGPMLGLVYLPAFVGLSMGSLISAPLGAKLGSAIDPRLLKKVFACVLLAVAAKLLLTA